MRILGQEDQGSELPGALQKYSEVYNQYAQSILDNWDILQVITNYEDAPLFFEFMQNVEALTNPNMDPGQMAQASKMVVDSADKVISLVDYYRVQEIGEHAFPAYNNFLKGLQALKRAADQINMSRELDPYQEDAASWTTIDPNTKVRFGHLKKALKTISSYGI